MVSRRFITAEFRFSGVDYSLQAKDDSHENGVTGMVFTVGTVTMDLEFYRTPPVLSADASWKPRGGLFPDERKRRMAVQYRRDLNAFSSEIRVLKRGMDGENTLKKVRFR